MPKPSAGFQTSRGRRIYSRLVSFPKVRSFPIGVVFALVCLLATGALANGAFPDSLGLLVSNEQPNVIVAATNFGLMVTQDAGESWHLICEEAIGPYGRLYQRGAAPKNRLY